MNVNKLFLETFGGVRVTYEGPVCHLALSGDRGTYNSLHTEDTIRPNKSLGLLLRRRLQTLTYKLQVSY